MKIRSDYVTNSSSSSFILSFKDEESIYNTLKEQFPENIENRWSAGDKGYFQQLLDDIKESCRLSKNDVREIIEIEDEGWPWGESCDDKVNKAMQKIGGDKVIVQVEHGDEGEGEDGMLEHEILPSLDCTVIRFFHH